jgi:hypothetical protein
MRSIILLFLLIFIQTDLWSQVESDTKIDLDKGEPRFSELLITAIFEYNIPRKDYAERFYGHPGMGLGFYWKSKSDLYLGADYTVFFRDQIRESGVIENILTSGGYPIAGDGLPADVEISQRGFNLNFIKVGKLLVHSGFLNGNIHSGLVGMLGVGLLQHKIKIVDNSGSVPGLTKDYLKGYDKLSNGLSLSPMLGYFYYDKKRYLNFFLAVEYKFAWTRNRRDWNNVDMTKEDDIRNDQAWAIKLGWFFLLRKKQSRDYYYF